METLTICDIRFSNLKSYELYAFLNDAYSQEKQILVVTPNVDFLIRAEKDVEFRSIINKADISLCDSAVIKMFATITGKFLKAKITGYDAMTLLLKLANEKQASIFLLGSKDEALALAAQKITSEYKSLRIAGTHDGFFDWENSPSVVDSVNASGAKFLFIGMGSPRQEKWAEEYRRKLNVKYIISIGGLFDIFSGKIKRAPSWMQRIGVEWAWRLAHEPGRLWKRYLVDDLRFFYLLFKEGAHAGSRQQI